MPHRLIQQLFASLFKLTIFFNQCLPSLVIETETEIKIKH